MTTTPDRFSLLDLNDSPVKHAEVDQPAGLPLDLDIPPAVPGELRIGVDRVGADNVIQFPTTVATPEPETSRRMPTPERFRAEGREVRPVSTPEPIATVPVVERKVTGADLHKRAILGLAEGRTGVLIGVRRGTGELTRATVVAALRAAGEMTGEPEDQTPESLAGKAVTGQNGRGYVARRVLQDDHSEECDAEWYVATTAESDLGRELGDPIGRRVIKCYLTGDVLTVHPAPGYEMVARVIENEYRRLTDYGVIRSPRDWFEGWLIRRCQGLPCGVGIYVPNIHAKVACAVTDKLASSWGENWSRGLSVATDDSWLDAMSRGVHDDLNEIATELAKARTEAREQGKGEVSPRAARGFIGRATEVFDRAATYGKVFGEARYEAIRQTAQRIVDSLANVAEGVRFEMLDLD